MRHISLLAGLLAPALLGAAAPAHADTVLDEPGAPTTVSVHGDVAAWSVAEGDGFRLVVDRGIDGQPQRAPVAPRGVPFDVDLGPGPDGGVVAAYSRCREEPTAIVSTAPAVAHATGRGCDLYLLELASGIERRLGGASDPAASEFLPTVWRDEVAFARVYERGRDATPPYLYVRDLEGSGSSRRLPGGPRGADGLPGPSGLDLYGRRLAFAWTWSEDGRGRAELRLDTLDGRPRLLDRAGWAKSLARFVGPHVVDGRIFYSLQRTLDEGDGPRPLASRAQRYRITNRELSVAPTPPQLTGLAEAGGRLLLAGAGRVVLGDPVDYESVSEDLPGGGRSILPARRVVAFYGAPQSERLGTLGVGSPATAARRLRERARDFERPNRPVLPAFELIASIALASPGRDGLYRARQSDAVIRRYLEAAREIGALLILDIQPGRADPLDEVRALRRWLREPDVGLAVDPEWTMGRGEVPGETIGSMDADTINAIADELSDIAHRRHLPQKLLLVHRFTDAMVRDEADIQSVPGVAIVESVDGFGTQGAKRSKYRAFTRDADGMFEAFKLFFEEDTNLFSPGQVLDLSPPPDVIIYE